MAEAWRLRAADEDGARVLAAGLGMRGLTGRILAARGFSTPESASRFLSPRLSDLRAPLGMADLDRAIDRILGAVNRGEKVGVFGDYDVDGVTSAAILVLMLRALGLEVVPRTARRASGYGFSPEDAASFVSDGCKLVLTGDCGTSDLESLTYCRSHTVDVIVIDHHHVPTGESQAFALLNSHRHDDTFAFKGLASCGVAFYLAAAVRTRLRADGHVASDKLDPRSWLDLVALGTIADMVPLVDENRILVWAGLRELSSLKRPGIAALAEVAGIASGMPLGTTEVSFRLAPRLNAAGRLGDSKRALDLLLATDRASANQLATDLDDLNRERQHIQEHIWSEAVTRADEFRGDPALVLGAEGWHQGVVGVIAAKLVEKYRKPAVVIGFSEGQGRGSARTMGGFDLCQWLSRCQDHLSLFGGHPMAAGVSLSEKNLPAFRAAFVTAARDHFGSGLIEEPVEVDAVASLQELDMVQAEELGRFAPFGNANNEPLIAVPGVVARSTRVVGSSHLQLTLAHGSSVSDAIAFGMGDKDPGKGARLDVIGTAEVDEFKGQRKIRLRLRHLLRTAS
jgi:single-stranded-DNA-specific exonuclease